jgi:hypothetical protein
MTCANPTVDVVVTLPRCRCCGRKHEQVLIAAERMRRVAGVGRLAGWQLRTRFRKVLGGAVDLICWFCQLEADRYVWAMRDAGVPAALRAAVLYRLRATARLAETWAGV